MADYEARCMKCKKNVKVKDPQQVEIKKGTWAVKGTHAECGTKLINSVNDKLIIKAKMANLVIKSNLKKAVSGLRIASDFADALNKVVEELIKKAGERAKANKRTTLMPQDL